MKHVVLLNVYGYKNIGDNAICSSAMDFIQDELKKSDLIDIFCESPKAFPKNIKVRSQVDIHYSCYGYAIRGNKHLGSFRKVIRFMNILYGTLFHLIQRTTTGFYGYIEVIRKADIVICMGGGYLRTKNNTDLFGIVLTVLPIYIAKIFRKKILFLPMSYGPFFNTFHEILCRFAIKNSTFICRDTFTLRDIKKIKSVSYVYIPDLALFLPWNENKKILKGYVVLTAREWMVKNNQEVYEKGLAEMVEYIWETEKLKTKFLPMGFNTKEDNDILVGERISQYLVTKDIFEISLATTPYDVQKILSNAKVNICTRLHSAILSATVMRPFISIGYEPKTVRFLQEHDLKKWYVSIEQMSIDNLKKLFEEIIQEPTYALFINKLEKLKESVQPYENKMREIIQRSLNVNEKTL